VPAVRARVARLPRSVAYGLQQQRRMNGPKNCRVHILVVSLVWLCTAGCLGTIDPPPEPTDGVGEGIVDVDNVFVRSPVSRVPSPPSSLDAWAVSTSRIDLRWSDINNDE